MDIRARAKRIKGLMGGLLRKSEHVTLTGQAIERAAERQRPKSMTPHDHEDIAAWRPSWNAWTVKGPANPI